MKVESLPKLKALSLFLALALTLSVIAVEPANGAPKRKTSARTVKKSAKSRSKSGRTVARRGSRSSKLKAGRSRRGSKLYARGRGRRSRWRRQVATSSHSAGVHNFLTQSWTQPLNAAERTPNGAEQGSLSAVPSPAGAQVDPATSGEAATHHVDATRPRVVTGDPLEPQPINPLVAAYTDSLATFGYSAENQGFIVTTLKGEVLAEHNADRLYNPASVTKVATSLTAISRLGPDFKFRTSLYTDGTLDTATGILHGSLYVLGSGDPGFFSENAMMIADKMNRSGIREVDGNLVVLGQFFFNFSTSREASAKAFRAVLTPETWSPQAKSSYTRFLAIRAAEDRVSDSGVPAPPLSGPPSLKISGQTITDPSVNTAKLTPLAVHTSLPLLRVLKGLNDFSNNWMATVIGNLVGGPDAVVRFLQTEIGFKEDEVRFATSSGLGANAISPRGTITMLRKLIGYLETKGLQLEDILPIAGVDRGTLERRFNDAYRGSVVGKTGTLSSVSALAGVAHTRQRGALLFVIYNQGGSAYRFRAAQDETIKKVITLYGGPAPVRYVTASGARITERNSEQSAGSRSSSNPR
ncbi:MAG TPA: D-alanyl-D-alanine carboxypeptidase [Blastocatellia bacterium]|nr:D-alanyl-D-alanine carboxypeptidase [Blastocatellia bacterium]